MNPLLPGSALHGDRAAHGTDISAASTITLAHRGARVGIQAEDPGMLQRVALLLPAQWQREVDAYDALYTLGVGDGEHRIWVDGELLLQTPDAELLVDRLLSDVHHRIAIAATDGLFVHAGVVAWRGRAIVLPGRTHSGKSTLVAALLRRGATYFSDEYAVFDGAGLVHPYPKLLALREGGSARRLCTPESLGSDVGTRAVRPAVVALLTYDENVTWELREITAGLAVLLLLDNTIHARERSGEALQTLSSALDGAITVAGRRGEAATAADCLLAMCEESRIS
ncbi:MAG TPA: hypothetical protein VKX16_19440 [Chloroflexota bacterium]|nr:hypothetical protein [Chloroflexota bacterium]